MCEVLRRYSFEHYRQLSGILYHSRGNESLNFYRVDDVFELEIVINEVCKQVKAEYDYVYRENWNWKDLKSFKVYY